jgi:hypothetical protein
MLTRIQVARRLGKSLSTVRRLEGTQLHPQVDHAGVHRFDQTEVDQMAAKIRQSGRSLGADELGDLHEITERGRKLERLEGEHAATLLYVEDLETKLAAAEKRARDPFYETYSEGVDVKAHIAEIQECCLWLLHHQVSITRETRDVSARLDRCLGELGRLASI